MLAPLINRCFPTSKAKVKGCLNSPKSLVKRAAIYWASYSLSLHWVIASGRTWMAYPMSLTPSLTLLASFVLMSSTALKRSPTTVWLSVTHSSMAATEICDSSEIPSRTPLRTEITLSLVGGGAAEQPSRAINKNARTYFIIINIKR